MDDDYQKKLEELSDLMVMSLFAVHLAQFTAFVQQLKPEIVRRYVEMAKSTPESETHPEIVAQFDDMQKFCESIWSYGKLLAEIDLNSTTNDCPDSEK